MPGAEGLAPSGGRPAGKAMALAAPLRWLLLAGTGRLLATGEIASSAASQFRLQRKGDEMSRSGFWPARGSWSRFVTVGQTRMCRWESRLRVRRVLPVILGPDLVELICGGVAVLVSTRDSDLQPEIVRAWGPEVSADGSSLTVCVPAAPGSRTAANLESSAPSASPPTPRWPEQTDASSRPLRHAPNRRGRVISRCRIPVKRLVRRQADGRKHRLPSGEQRAR